MPSEDSDSKKDSNFKIIALVAIFLLISLVAVLFYYQNYMKSDSYKGSSNTTTYDSNTWVTYTSKAHAYSISYPGTWTKTEAATSNTPGGDEIILLNLSDRESRNNGKPNMIIYAGSVIDFCNYPEPPFCKEEKLTVNGREIKKFTPPDSVESETDDIYYDLGDGILVFATPNGDQSVLDEIIKTFKKG